MHTDDIVFHNHTAGERVEGADAVASTSPASSATGRACASPAAACTCATRLVVQEWTATGTHAESGKTATWDGMDILPTRDGRFARKDVYSDSVSVHAPARPPLTASLSFTGHGTAGGRDRAPLRRAGGRSWATRPCSPTSAATPSVAREHKRLSGAAELAGSGASARPRWPTRPSSLDDADEEMRAFAQEQIAEAAGRAARRSRRRSASRCSSATRPTTRT